MKTTKAFDEILSEEYSSPVRPISMNSSVQSPRLRKKQNSETIIKINKATMDLVLGNRKSEVCSATNDRVINLKESKLASLRLTESARRPSTRAISREKSPVDQNVNNFTQQRAHLLGIRSSSNDNGQNNSVTSSYHFNKKSSILVGSFLEKKRAFLNSSRLMNNNRSNESLSQLFYVADARTKPQDIKERLEYFEKMTTRIVNESFSNDKLTQITKNCFLQFKFLLDKAYMRYVLFPDTDKEFIDSLLGVEERTLSMVRHIANYTKELLTSKHELENNNKDLSDQIKQLKIIVSDLRSDPGSSSGKGKKIENTFKTFREQSEQAERVWFVERQQLKNEVERLDGVLQKIYASDEVNQVHKKITKMNTQVLTERKKYEEEGDKKITEIAKLENWLARSNSAIKGLQKENNDLKEKCETLTSELEDLRPMYKQSLERKDMYREIAYMTKEDMSQSNRKCLDVLETLGKSHIKYAVLQSKLDRMKQKASDDGGFDVEEVSKDQFLLENIKAFFKASKHPIMSLRLSQVEKEPKMKKPDEPIQIEKYSFYKPTFSSLIQKVTSKTDFGLPNEVGETMIGAIRGHIATIRGLFDSKYNEFMYYNNHRMYSPFPDFVYSWLNSFMVCSIQKKVKPVNPLDNTPIEVRKQKFYQFLGNPHASKLWEVSAFKDFLGEEYASDELFFYLHSRYVLFGGPQLMTLSGVLNTICWMRLDQVESSVQKILSKMDQEQHSDLIRLIRKRAKAKDDNLFVDSAFVLKALLDIYRIDKIKRFEILRASFTNISVPGRQGRLNLSFDLFRQYLERSFPFLSEVEKARLYRETWCIGNGSVDGDSFFIIANENNLYVESLKLTALHEANSIKAIDKEEKLVQDKSTSIIKFFETKFDDLQKMFDEWKPSLEELGIEEIMFNVIYREKELAQIFSYKKERSVQFLYSALTELMQIFIKTKNQYCLVFKKRLEQSKQLMVSDIEGFTKLMMPLDKSIMAEQKEYEDKIKRVRKIQQLFRKKKSSWHNFMKSLIKKPDANNLKVDGTVDAVKNGDIADKYVKEGVFDLL